MTISFGDSQKIFGTFSISFNSQHSSEIAVSISEFELENLPVDSFYDVYLVNMDVLTTRFHIDQILASNFNLI